MTEYAETARSSYGRPRRRPRGWGFLLAAFLILGVIALVGDRVAAEYAARELRGQLVAELSDRGIEYGTVDVSIGGFPFLTQVADGHYDEIVIDMTDVALPDDGGEKVTLPSLRMVANGVDAETAEVVQGRAKVTAQQVSGTAVMEFGTLEQLIDYSQYNLTEVRFTESDGALRFTGTTSLAGIEVPIAATAEVSVADGQVQVQLRDAEARSVPVPALARNYIAGLVERSVTARLPDLPFNLALDRVSVDPGGLAIAASGSDVPLVS